MDSDITSQIDALKRDQARLQDELHRLGNQCDRVAQDLQKLGEMEFDEKPPANEPQAPTPEATLIHAIDLGRQHIESASPPPLPADLAKLAAVASTEHNQEAPQTQKASPEVSPVETSHKDTENIPTSPTPAPSPIPQTAPQQKPAMNVGEWELNFGQVWLVRIGVVFLLTGLVFLSTYAYKNWLFHSGPAVKVSFFMIISIALTGTGLWLENWKVRFKQYGRALAAGGLAAGYYTLYASHFTPALKIISSPVLAGLLLTIWAGIMLSYAVWKQSRIVAVMAIGLAFYGTIINPAGWLALFSSLLLSSAGMWLLLRFRWIGIGLGTVIAAYVAHAFWLGYYPAVVEESVRLTYLACYWLLFTIAVAVPQARTLDLKIQRAICAINNASAWTLTVFLIPRFIHHQEIGWISIGMGTLWILIAAAIRLNASNKAWHPSLAVIFGYQGILIVSLGILLEATGYTRFLVMAVEACVLLAGARHFGGTLARVASLLAFACALLTALPIANLDLALDLTLNMTPGWGSYTALALVCAAYTVLVRRDNNHSAAFGQKLPLFPAASTWVVLIWGVFTQWQLTTGMNGLWFTATVVMLAYFLLKKPWWLVDLAIPSIFVAMGAGWWFLTTQETLSLSQSLCPIFCVAVFWFMAPRLTQAADQWLENGNQTENALPLLEWIFSILMWVMAFCTIHQFNTSPTQWLIVGGIMAIVGNAAAHFTQRKSVGVPPLLMYGVVIVNLIFIGSNFPWLGWMPAGLILLHLALTDTLWPILGKKKMCVLLSLALVATTGIHAFQELDRPDLMLTALGAGLMAWAYARNDRSFAAAGAIPALIIACLSVPILHGHQDWGRYLPIIVIMLIHSFLWFKKTEKDMWLKPRTLLLSVALISLFIASSQHVRASFDGSGLSICWALTAMLLFGIGLLMRCRPYRLVGLFWLAAAIVHVIGVDVMRLGSLGRILSFITLGLVLLILGFLYNRFQEAIRKFL